MSSLPTPLLDVDASLKGDTNTHTYRQGHQRTLSLGGDRDERERLSDENVLLEPTLAQLLNSSVADTSSTQAEVCLPQPTTSKQCGVSQTYKTPVSTPSASDTQTIQVLHVPSSAPGHTIRLEGDGVTSRPAKSEGQQLTMHDTSTPELVMPPTQIPSCGVIGHSAHTQAVQSHSVALCTSQHTATTPTPRPVAVDHST